MKRMTIPQPYQCDDGEPFAVEIRTAASTTIVPCHDAEEAAEVRDSILTAGLHVRVRVLGLPATVAIGGFFEDETDRAELPEIAD